MSTSNEYEEGDFTSDDDDLGGPIDQNEDWFNDEFSDPDQNDVASLDHLLDEDDEIREARLNMMNLNSKQKNGNVEDFKDGNENVPIGIDDSLEMVEDEHTHTYQHDDFLIKTCESYDRDAFIEEEEVDSENEKSRSENGCPWRLWASWMSSERSFQVKSLDNVHRCGRSYNLGSLVNSNWIAKIVSARRKPIITMHEEIRLTIMERFEKMAKRVEKWNGDICRIIKKKVERNKDQMRVNPLNAVKLWPTTNFAKPLPPKFRRMPDRPSISRRKDACEGGSRSRTNNFEHEEVGRTGRRMTCKNCWKVGITPRVV
ncbi:hypothetical protein OSB04_016914 [Centaurea solstitialis]|uniref:Uncharacterized protein n=1 Tax=Centaurea solstitialis TaxID=347529 RepID=A0AA38T1X5_9ASTR|nr:hypothetical protein OSB04_016914 [Centaurea solstitialis]